MLDPWQTLGSSAGENLQGCRGTVGSLRSIIGQSSQMEKSQSDVTIGAGLWCLDSHLAVRTASGRRGGGARALDFHLPTGNPSPARH